MNRMSRILLAAALGTIGTDAIFSRLEDVGPVSTILKLLGLALLLVMFAWYQE